MDSETFTIMQRMHESAGLRPPDPARYTITESTSAPVEAAASGEQQAAGTAQQQTGWDLSAFAALPDDQRAGVMAGAAVALGRQVLELAAEKVLNVPSDVHHHLTNPEQYVDANGIVDTEAITTALNELALRRADLAKPGVGRNRPTPRQAPAGIGGGGPAGPTEAEKVRDTLARMQETRW